MTIVIKDNFFLAIAVDAQTNKIASTDTKHAANPTNPLVGWYIVD